MALGYLALGILLMVGVAFLLRWFVNADPALLVGGTKYAAIGLVILGIVLLILVGSIGWVPTLIAPILPFLLRWQLARLRGRVAAGPSYSPGQTSRVDTAWLAMELDHASGTIDGTVRAGRFANRRLGELSLDELLHLLAECRVSDPESIAVLEAYLDRAHPGDWRERMAAGESAAGAARQRPASGMTREEAFEVLGLASDASEAEIRDAHRRLMLKIHPDQGGSNYLAAQINRAKDLLLGA